MGRKVNIRPSVNVLGMFRDMNYKPWYAIGEFVDNSLQSYLDNADKLRRRHGRGYKFRIDITTNPDNGGELVVHDNAGGIGLDRFDSAFETAAAPPERNLSRYGVGMKAAACWFSPNWKVRTKALDEAVRRVVVFDVPVIRRRELETLDVEEQPVKRTDGSFTEISMKPLYEARREVFSGRTIAKVKSHLASIYRIYLRRGELILRVNGVELEYTIPDVLHAIAWESAAGKSGPAGTRKLDWEKDLNFRFGKYQATGRAALRAKGKRSEAGFAVFQRDRLILGSGGSPEDAYRPSDIFGGPETYRSLRLFGEVHVPDIPDEIEPVSTKDQFTWSDATHSEFRRALKEALNAAPLRLLTQADNYRSRTAEVIGRRGIEAALEGTADSIGALGPIVEEQVRGSSVESPPTRLPSTDLRGSRESSIEINGETWLVTIELSQAPGLEEWVAVRDTEAGPAGARAKRGKKSVRRLGIQIATEHPFMQKWVRNANDLEAVLRIATGIALAVITAREIGAGKTYTVLSHLNAYMFDALAAGDAWAEDKEEPE